MSLKEPIVEGASKPHSQCTGCWKVIAVGHEPWCVSCGQPAVRRVYLVPTDPAEVVAELRERASANSSPEHPAIRGSFPDGCAVGLAAAAELVAEKLGVK